MKFPMISKSLNNISRLLIGTGAMGTESQDGADRLSAGNEVLWRMMGRESAFDVRLQIGHPGLCLDAKGTLPGRTSGTGTWTKPSSPLGDQFSTLSPLLLIKAGPEEKSKS
jgi:hypothetical protein